MGINTNVKHLVPSSCVNIIQGQTVRYLSQNFSTAVALPRGRISDDPCHFWWSSALIHSLSARLAGSLRWFTHVDLLEPAAPLYFHINKSLSTTLAHWMQQPSPSDYLYPLPPHTPRCVPPLSDVTRDTTACVLPGSQKKAMKPGSHILLETPSFDAVQA